MKTKADSLKIIIHLIKSCGKELGIDITEVEMVQKLQVTENLFKKYLTGEKRMPNNFTYLLLTAYDDVIKAQQRQNASLAIRNAIALVKKMGVAEGIVVTDEEIAQKMDMSMEQLAVYIKGEEHTPTEKIAMLHLAYKENLLKSISFFSHTVTEQVKYGDRRFNRRQ